MAINLAPYNDAMTLGQGYNSYTQTLCIDNAVRVKPTPRKSGESLSQVVSYSVRIVEKLSDVVEGLNLSYCSSIKKGTVEVSGSTTTVNENAFKSSDLNAVVSVKVTNQTVSVEQNATFLPLHGVPAGSVTFNETYGDSFISGFIEGGEFTGIVSIKVIDRSEVSKTVNTIKNALGSAKQTKDVVFSEFDAGDGTNLSSAMKGIESTVSVAWMGGGQIKAPTTQWDLESVLAAAAAFPAHVADCPQRTWAILTKYKANRSFVQWSRSSVFETLEYDQINSYSAELFDHYMDYKLLLKQMQMIISSPDDFEMNSKVQYPLDTSIKTLLSARTALRMEQAKIVEAVEVLSKDPGCLKRNSRMALRSPSNVVNDILNYAKDSLTWKRESVHQAAPSARKFPLPPPLFTDAKPTEAAPAHEPGDDQGQGAEDDDNESSADAPELTPENSEARSDAPPQLSFDFTSLIPPEVWSTVMPVPKASSRQGLAGVTFGFGKLPPHDGITPMVAPDTMSLESAQRSLEAERKAKIAAEDRAKAAEEKTTQTQTTKDAEIKKLSEEKAKLSTDLQTKTTEASTATAARDQANGQVQTLTSQLSTAKGDLSKAQDEKQKAQEESKKQAGIADGYKLQLITNPGYEQDRVNIIAVFVGAASVSQIGTMNQTMARYAISKQQFKFRDAYKEAGGTDSQLPQISRDAGPFGSISVQFPISFNVVYRYDKKGPIRFLWGNLDDVRKFDEWNS